MTNLSDPIYTNELAARRHWEAIRWPKGRKCPQCQTIGFSTETSGRSVRPGNYKCNHCLRGFTVATGTMFEWSQLTFNIWLLDIHYMVSSVNGLSDAALHRILKVGSYRSIWSMAQRIRQAIQLSVRAEGESASER